MQDPLVDKYLETLESRYVEGIGFANRPGGEHRPDATCWSILALEAAGTASEMVRQGRQALVAEQLPDGRVCISPEHRDAFWPTALAILAWKGSPPYQDALEKAIGFLLEFDEVRTTQVANEIMGHDGTIRGWPWVARTHPWVEPTALALMALRVSGYTAHSRTQDALRLLIDRQLSAGGWNYGNTTVFGRQLRPMPETTGMALQAICGLVPSRQVEKSISYLHARLPSLCTPLALAWAILGLNAWDEKIQGLSEHVTRVLQRQHEYGPYDTVSLSALLFARHAENGLIHFLEQSGQRSQIS
jgi:hypothetical protein